MTAPSSHSVTLGRRPLQRATAQDIVQEVDQRLQLYEPLRLPSFLVSDASKEHSSTAGGPQQAKISKVKTSHVLIFMCLHIGNDPPDYTRIEPCAKLECWTDPAVAQARSLSRGSDGIADTLEQQYRTIQKDAMYKKLAEATIDDAKQQLQAMRRKARDGRVLVHYNGHGMPRATSLGELWFFDKDRTHYVPFHINELAGIVESPAIYVIDCNCAGYLLQHWQPQGDSQSPRSRDFMLCACSENEMLPLNPLLPADILTSCLTTPMKMVLEWYIGYSYRKTLLPNVTEEMIRHVPGDISDRKTPLGELSWILTAVTDTIAWCTTPEHLFHQLFRQDVVVKSLFRNFLLAEKLLREVGCTPMSYPQLPDTTYSHYMWDTWDVALESILCQLPNLLNSDMTPNTLYTYKPTTFFADQLTAFDGWVEQGDYLELPEQLPCVVLALTQISHRLRALKLLSRYLSTGPNAVHYSVRCGVLLYLSKLLMNTPEVFLPVTLVWSQIIAVDPSSACAELVKHAAEKQFIRLIQIDASKVIHLHEVEQVSSAIPSPASEDAPLYYDFDGVDLARCKAAACFILCKMLDHGGEKMFLACWNASIGKAVFPFLADASSPELRSWGCLVLAKVFGNLRAAKEFACKEYASRIDLFANLLHDKHPGVRSSCVTLLSTILGSRVDTMDDAQQLRRIESDKSIMIKLRGTLFDHSSAVRQELAFGCAQIFHHYGALLPECTVAENILAVPPDTEWNLDEAAVQVKSLLNASRPTDNVMFDDSFQFNTVFLAKDSPAPPASWNTAAVSPRVLEIIHGLLHDASVILSTLHQNADQRHVAKVLVCIQNNTKVASFRLASETNAVILDGIQADDRCALDGCTSLSASSSPTPSQPRLGGNLASSSSNNNSSTVHLSEDDRAKRSRNRDLMRQLILDVQGRKFEPPGAGTQSTPTMAAASAFAAAPPTTGSASSTNGGGGGGSAGTVTAGGSVASSPLEPSKAVFLQSHCLSQPHDVIVSAHMRLLEPQVVVAERNNRITVVDYESNADNTPNVVQQMVYHSSSPVASVLVINDLAVDPGIVVLNRSGGFNIFRGIGPRVTPQEVCSFAANSSNAAELRMGYRSDGHLLYCGPTKVSLTNSLNEVVVVNLVEEQVSQRVAVVGDAQVTCFTVHPTARSFFVGMSDGIVKYFDDRAKQGQVSAVSNLQKRGPLAVGDNIVGVALCDDASSGSPLTVAAATSNAIRIFDIRQPSQPTKIVEVGTPGPGTSVTGSPATGRSASSGGTAVRKRTITSFDGALYTGLLSVIYSDGSFDILNSKVCSVLPKQMMLKESQQFAASTSTHNAAATLAGAGLCVMHPLRPTAFFAGEIITVL